MGFQHANHDGYRASMHGAGRSLPGSSAATDPDQPRVRGPGAAAGRAGAAEPAADRGPLSAQPAVLPVRADRRAALDARRRGYLDARGQLSILSPRVYSQILNYY